MTAALLPQFAVIGAAAAPSLPATSGAAEFWVFWLLAPIALGAAIAMVALPNPVHAALALVVNFVMIALLFAVLEAQFLAIVQIIVYAGAIMVLFLFVLMLLGVDTDQGPGGAGVHPRGQRPAALVLGAVLLVALVVGVAGPYLGAATACNVPAGAEPTGPPCQGLAQVNGQPGGNVRALGLLLFTKYVWPFEVASVLLVIAALGAILLGRRREQQPDDVVDTRPVRADEAPSDAVTPPARQEVRS